MATSQPDLPLEAVVGAKEALACLTIGAIVSAGWVFLPLFLHIHHGLIRSLSRVYGVTVLQAYIYFRKDIQHSTHMRYFVSPRARGR